MITREYTDNDCAMFEFEDGTIVYVGTYNCGIEGFGPSSVNYYYDSECGYNCANEREVAMKVYEHFPHQRGKVK